MENKIIQLEHEIQSIITKDNGCTVHFEYGSDNSSVSVFTTNPNTKEIFLLKKSKYYNIKEHFNNRETALEEVLEYVKNQKELDTFTIIWNKRNNDSNVKETSYFYCHDIQDAIDKFFTGKNVKDYIIYEVKMNARA